MDRSVLSVIPRSSRRFSPHCGLEDFELPCSSGMQAGANAQWNGQHGPRCMAYRSAEDQRDAQRGKDAPANVAHGDAAAFGRIALGEIAQDESAHAAEFAGLREMNE